MKYRILTILLLLSIVSCTQSTSLNESEKVVIIDQVRQTLDNYYKDIKLSGLTAEFKYLDNSSDFFWVPPGHSNSISYDKVTAILNENAPKYKSIDNSFQTLQIIPLSNELATYTGQIRSTIKDLADKETTITLVETGVMIKRPDGWKLLHGQTTILNQ